jgi:hypothetical protein
MENYPMRKHILASLLILTGSTVAIAQTTPQTTQEAPDANADEALNNQTETTSPTDPADTTTTDTPDASTPDATTPPAETPTTPPQG